MESMDYWRLCDELNIVQAALLVVNSDAALAEYAEHWDVEKRPHGYEAAKTAIVHALKRYQAYLGQMEVEMGDMVMRVPVANARLVSSIQAPGIEGNLVPKYDSDMNGNTLGPIDGSVDLWNSTIVVSSLKEWLSKRGFAHGFFFPAEDTPDFLNPVNPRYAPKLAAAVRAWQAVTEPGNTSPKKALDKWLRENAAHFGLTDEEGNPVNQAIEECSKIANWQPGGGAPKTPS